MESGCPSTRARWMCWEHISDQASSHCSLPMKYRVLELLVGVEGGRLNCWYLLSLSFERPAGHHRKQWCRRAVSIGGRTRRLVPAVKQGQVGCERCRP